MRRAALTDSDPWRGFVTFTEALFALHAEHRGLNDALAQRVPLSPGLIEACARAGRSAPGQSPYLHDQLHWRNPEASLRLPRQ